MEPSPNNKRTIFSGIYILLPLFLFISFCNKKDSTPSPAPAKTGLLMGADISWITQMESNGIKFYSRAGSAMEATALMKSLGFNLIRLRVWVNPANGYNNTADVIAKALRATNLGMKLLIDFHYSDTWADPGNQTKPAAWVGLSFSDLTSAMANHTTEVLTQLKSRGVTPEMVQIGNETNNGMLWPEGKASSNMGNFSVLINAGYDAVKAVFPAAKVMVHISNGYDNGLFRWMFDGLTAFKTRYDVIGLSLYPSAGNWNQYNSQCFSNMNDMVSRYGKEVMVVETGMPWTDSTVCKTFLTDLIQKTASVTGNRGLGVVYWEPESYNNWNGYSLGAFDGNGKPTMALNAFSGQ